jgi:hypothetical protein
MAHADTDRLIRQLINDDAVEADGLLAYAKASDDPMVLVVAALTHPGEDGLLAQALRAASASRDRQVIAIASAWLAGEAGRVDALAREHLADYPDSVLVAWLAASASPPAEVRRTHLRHQHLEES